MGVEPKIKVGPQNGWFMFMENPIKMDDLRGPPLFLETPIYTLYHVDIYWVPIPRAPWGGKQLGALHPKGPPPFSL